MKTLSDNQVRTLVAEFHTNSEEDIVGLFAVAKEVYELLEDENAAREQTLRVVGAMLKSGMIAGDPPYSPGGYTPWPNQTPEVVLNRIRSEWLALKRRPDIPDIAWFGPAKQA